MCKPVSEPVRINTRISKDANDWLDRKSAEMAVSKSSLVNFAVQKYITEHEVVAGMPLILKKLEELGVDINE